MQARVISPDEANEFWFHEGCHILEISNTGDDPALSIARARVAPGATTRWHVLDGVAERYLILRGEGEVGLGECETHPVGPGDFVCIPPGTPQRIHNTGKDELVFLAICTPRFTPACYRGIDKGKGETAQAQPK